MVKFELFIDPFEVEYPSLVRELLADAHKKVNVSATVTLGKCLLICGNSVYIWSYVSKEMGIPNATRANLPSSGLKYSLPLICLFSKGQHLRQLLCLLVISPEGNVRYWPELGKQQHRDETCLLNNEVAHSVQLVESQESIHRFLVTTTTGSFHMIDISHSSAGQPERIATRPLDVGGPGGGIGRRMSLMLFGNFSAEKEEIVKTLIVRGKFGSADLVNVQPRYLRFYSILERKTKLHEIDIADMALSKYNKSHREQAERLHFLVIDAAPFRSGILLLFVSVLSQEHFNRCKNIFIGYYEESIQPQQSAAFSHFLRTLVKVNIPESLVATGLERHVKNCKLLVCSTDECAVVFPNAFLLVRNPIKSSDVRTYYMDSFGDANEQLLGAETVHGLSTVVLKEKGICTIRKLPELFDLAFWKKYRTILHQMDESTVFPGDEHRLKDAFIEFCAKDIKRSRSIVREFATFNQSKDTNESAGNDETQLPSSSNQKVGNNIAEMTLDLILFLLDRQPSLQEDPRWSYTPKTPISNEQMGQLRELASTRKFALISKQLSDKLAQYKMFLLFLRTFNLIELIDHPLDAFQNRNGKAVVVELGEKLLAMVVCFHWLAENAESLPLVNSAINELAKHYVTRFGLPKGNPYLSAIDFIFSRVSSFHELVPAIIQTGEQAMEEHCNDKSQILMEVGSFLVTLINGIMEVHNEKWALFVEDDHSTWLNHPDFLTHFITQLNAALDFLQSTRSDASGDNSIHNSSHQNSVIFEHCVQIADFVLSQQSPTQRNDSKIIARFVTLGKVEVALKLAEKFKDFTMLIVYCHKRLDKHRCAEALEQYKQRYEKDGFHDFLYTWYQQNGMYNHLLAEKGKRVSDFLANRQRINWIRQIDEGEFRKAWQTLVKMGDEEKDEQRKNIAYSLAKMAALCENNEDVIEIAEISEKLRASQEESN